MPFFDDEDEEDVTAKKAPKKPFPSKGKSSSSSGGGAVGVGRVAPQRVVAMNAAGGPAGSQQEHDQKSTGTDSDLLFSFDETPEEARRRKQAALLQQREGEEEPHSGPKYVTAMQEANLQRKEEGDLLAIQKIQREREAEETNEELMKKDLEMGQFTTRHYAKRLSELKKKKQIPAKSSGTSSGSLFARPSACSLQQQGDGEESKENNKKKKALLSLALAKEEDQAYYDRLNQGEQPAAVVAAAMNGETTANTTTGSGTTLAQQHLSSSSPALSNVVGATGGSASQLVEPNATTTHNGAPKLTAYEEANERLRAARHAKKEARLMKRLPDTYIEQQRQLYWYTVQRRAEAHSKVLQQQ